MATDFLLMIGEREPLAWIPLAGDDGLRYPSQSGGEAARGRRPTISVHDVWCFHNPGKDQGRVIGEAMVRTAVKLLDQPVEFGERSFPLGCSLEISGLVPRGAGPVLFSLVDELNLFPNPTQKNWGIRLRRVLAPLDRHDAGVLHNALSRVIRPPSEARAGYLEGTRFATPAGG